MIDTQQLRAAGLDADAVARRVAAGRLHPMFLGVYAVGHRAITRDAWFLAATLAVGDDSGLGFFSACQHYGIWEGQVGAVHVVVPGRRAQHRDRIHIHSVRSPPNWREVRGVRVVEPALAVVQFAAVVADPFAIKRVAREAQVLELATQAELLRACDRNRGAKRLRTALEGGPAPTRNGGEDAALAFLRSCGLDPLVNVPMLGFVADFLLPEHRVVVEFDGRVHDIPIVRGDDHARQAVFEAAGYRVIRLRWRDITAFRAQARARILTATAT